jgi:hypothetical protein
VGDRDGMDIYSSKVAKIFKWLNRVPRENAFGITTGPDTTRYSCTYYEIPEALKRHEECHKSQYRRYGSRIKFWFAYLRMQIMYGYKANPFEVEARAAE